MYECAHTLWSTHSPHTLYANVNAKQRRPIIRSTESEKRDNETAHTWTERIERERVHTARLV